MSYPVHPTSDAYIREQCEAIDPACSIRIDHLNCMISCIPSHGELREALIHTLAAERTIGYRIFVARVEWDIVVSTVGGYKVEPYPREYKQVSIWERFRQLINPTR